MLSIVALSYLFVINALTFLAFKADKNRAVAGAWRIPESTLLLMSFCGGWPAAKIAQRRFRHKTRKQPFVFSLNAIPLVWSATLFVLVALANTPEFPQYFATAFVSETQAAPERATPKFFTKISH